MSVVVLERDADVHGRARAIATEEEVIRIWQSVGLAEEVKADMLTGLPSTSSTRRASASWLCSRNRVAWGTRHSCSSISPRSSAYYVGGERSPLLTYGWASR